MFTSHKQLIRNSGKKGVDRREFLQELINEFYQSASLGNHQHNILKIVRYWKSTVFFVESQEQVLANLANFAYDPLNYHYIRELRVIDLFVKSLESRNPYFVQYSLKGLCNCVNDPLNQHIIYEKGGINRLKQLVQSSDASLVKDSLTTLNFLSSSPYHTGSVIKTWKVKISIPSSIFSRNISSWFH